MSIILSFSVFVIIFLGVGACAAKYSNSSEDDYLLGGKEFGPLFIGLSAGATGNSGFIMLAAVGMGYTMGVSALVLPIGWFIGDLFFWLLFPRRINQLSSVSNSLTVPELLSSRFSGKDALHIRFVSSLIILLLVGAYLAAQFTAAAKTLNVFFEVDINIGIILSALGILAYCTTGGLKASIWTDMVQALVMIAISWGVTVFTYFTLGGLDAITLALKNIDPQLVNIFSEQRTLLLLFLSLFSYATLGFGFDLSQPQVLVRILAGKSPDAAKKAKWYYLFFTQSTWLTMTVCGIFLRILLPDVSDPEQALPIYAVQTFNPWVVGCVLAGIFSAIASTADSQLLVCSSAIAVDIMPRVHKTMEERFGIWYHYAITFMVGLIGALAAIYCSNSVLTIILFAIGALACSLGPAMVILLLDVPTNKVALNVSMVAGLLVSVVWRLYGLHDSLTEMIPGFATAFLVHCLLLPRKNRNNS